MQEVAIKQGSKWWWSGMMCTRLNTAQINYHMLLIAIQQSYTLYQLKMICLQVAAECFLSQSLT